jgi:suppressor of ftsI
MRFEGTLPGPTLSVCPGDRLTIDLANDLGSTPAAWIPVTAHGPDAGVSGEHEDVQLTNLHTHGLHVSPEGNSDNVYVSIPPGEGFTNEYEIPEDHPPGFYWYHPHRHGFVLSQVYAGMFGAIQVGGGLDDLPELENVPTRTMIISSHQLGKNRVVPVEQSETPKSPYFINGELNPTIPIGPGETQRWRILNANGNAIVKLGLDGHDFRILATDGNTLAQPERNRKMLIGPGERVEVLVTGGKEGTYELESLPFAQFQDGMLAGSTIATLRSTRGPAPDRVPSDLALPILDEDLSDAEVDDRHRIVFSEREVADGRFEFLFNDKVFDEDRVDVRMKLGEVNEWELVNDSEEWHTFHIHVNDFQVTGFRAGRVPRVSSGKAGDVKRGVVDPEDTVKLPPGATVTLRTRPTDFTGKYVFHCHMLNHEDRGMMANVEVVD